MRKADTPGEYRKLLARAYAFGPGMQAHRLTEASIRRSYRPTAQEQERVQARLNTIRELPVQVLNDLEISELLQLSGNTIWRLRSKRMGLPTNDNRGGTRSTPNLTKETHHP